MENVIQTMQESFAMDKYNVIPNEVKEYYIEKVKESGIFMVPGHYPVLKTKEEIDCFIDIRRKSFEEYFSESWNDDDSGTIE